MMQVQVTSSIEAFGRDEWNRLFPDELEDWAYYHAVERAGLPEFTWVYFGVRQDGRLRAVAPAFVTDYYLGTTLTGTLKRVADAIMRVFPRLLCIRLLSLGSPVAEICHLGIESGVDAATQKHLLDAILGKMQEYAKQHRIGMIAAKDTSATQDALWAQAACSARLRRQPGLPTAYLDVHFSSLDEYLQSLSRATRKDLRRKFKSNTALRVEWRNDVAGIDDDVMRLYRETYANAELNFEELTSEYFAGVLRELGEHASCVAYWLGDRLVAFNLVLHDGKRLLDKFLGMDYAVARDYNLYFCTWMENVRYCIEHGLTVYQSGQGLHREKLRLGSRLSPNWLWYRHRNRVLDAILAVIEHIARLDRHDPELAALLKEPQT